ncbi:LamB/YcsF family protein [Allobacillus sp. GCM10007491]|uniref:5-oxoprolinase subunit A n=1 Tax=Allobacillus saliphilus TaxID=2912308 RepID=A0A941CWQ0_9BACI|nr:5-oxoprolinase subunit PxpA [Allobacillus saliphilus]MBR7554579.1 LamB/YcsF family protein [Allobacillus saliphilus]
MAIDFNADLGEGYGAFSVGNDEELLSIISSCNIACGFHAGDYKTIPQTVKRAMEKGVQIGAHPSFYDLHGFGRRNIPHTPEDIYELMIYQLGALQAFVRLHGGRLNHVKPHGALYNMGGKDPSVALAIAQAVKDFDRRLVLFGLANSELIRVGQQVGLETAQEAFADRTYQNDGTLTPRSEKNAVLHDTESVVEQALRIAQEGKVTSVDGTDIELHADTLCFHGDTPEAVEHAKACKQAFEKEGIHITTTFGM